MGAALFYFSIYVWDNRQGQCMAVQLCLGSKAIYLLQEERKGHTKVMTPARDPKQLLFFSWLG